MSGLQNGRSSGSVTLGRLSPKARAAYLLHEVFDIANPEVARTLGLDEAACRKLVSPTHDQLAQAKVRHTLPPERQEALLAAFQTAITDGETESLAALLAKDVRLITDGGGKVPALLEPLVGKAEVLDVLVRSLRAYWVGYTRRNAEIYNIRGLLVELGDGGGAAVSFAFNAAELIDGLFIVRNPEKLRDMARVEIL